MSTFGKYLKTFALIGAVSILVTLVLNLIADPLWYAKGNRLSEKNLPFNERISKTNLFLRTLDEKKYDCLIFGSSRATLLRHSLFQDNTCFNYAFSAGKIEEFVAYSKFAKDHGVEPSIIYVGIDAFNFRRSIDSTESASIDPLPFYRAYLSLDVLQFSIRTLLNQASGPRYYNSSREFESETFDQLPPYQPELLNSQSINDCDTSKVNKYLEIQRIFPNAKVVGFVAPISAWHLINTIYFHGNLMSCSLDGIYQISQSYDTVYDFSIPSSVTLNPENSYDPDHYYPFIQDQVANIIQGSPSDLPKDFGVAVGALSAEDYVNDYTNRVESFLAKEERRDHW